MNRQIAAIAPRTQTHIDPKHKTISGIIIEQPNNALSKPGHKTLIINTARAFCFVTVRFTARLMDENQVDITG